MERPARFRLSPTIGLFFGGRCRSRDLHLLFHKPFEGKHCGRFSLVLLTEEHVAGCFAMVLCC